VTDFVNLKIKLAQFFECAHRDRGCIFIGMSTHIYIYINIYIYIVFKKKFYEVPAQSATKDAPGAWPGDKFSVPCTTWNAPVPLRRVGKFVRASASNREGGPVEFFPICFANHSLIHASPTDAPPQL
jgi:hypothetical protein